MGILLVLTAVLHGVAEALSERAHGLVDEGGERRAIVALEARVMQVMIPYKCSESNQKSATNTNEALTGRSGSGLRSRCGQQQG